MARRYERDVGPFSRAFARAAVAELPRASVRVLDHGAGTGIVTRLVHARLPAAHVTAVEPSAALASTLPRARWCDVHLGTEVLDPIDPIDAVVSNLVVMFCPDTVATFDGLRRISAEGGVLLATALGAAERVEPFHRYWSAVRNQVDDAWEPTRYPHHRFAGPEQLVADAEAAGWRDVSVDSIVTVRRLHPDAAWRWVRRALPVGRGDGYGELDRHDIEQVRRRFLDDAPSKWRSEGWLLRARH